MRLDTFFNIIVPLSLNKCLLITFESDDQAYRKTITKHFFNPSHDCMNQNFSLSKTESQATAINVEYFCLIHLAPLIRRSDNAIHWINLYLVDNAIRFAITYPLDSDLSVGQRYPLFIQLGPGPSRLFHVPSMMYRENLIARILLKITSLPLL